MLISIAFKILEITAPPHLCLWFFSFFFFFFENNDCFAFSVISDFRQKNRYVSSEKKICGGRHFLDHKCEPLLSARNRYKSQQTTVKIFRRRVNSEKGGIHEGPVSFFLQFLPSCTIALGRKTFSYR